MRPRKPMDRRWLRKLREQLRDSMKLPLEKAREQCMKCHDLDNSPDFHEEDAFEDVYWPEVEHYGLIRQYCPDLNVDPARLFNGKPQATDSASISRLRLAVQRKTTALRLAASIQISIADPRLRTKKGEADPEGPTPPRTGGRLISRCASSCLLRSRYMSNLSPGLSVSMPRNEPSWQFGER